MLGSNYFHYVRDPWGSFAEYSFDIDFVPHDLEWPAADHPPDDSLYVWGPPVPDDFITNHEQDRGLNQEPAQMRLFAFVNDAGQSRTGRAHQHRSIASTSPPPDCRPRSTSFCAGEAGLDTARRAIEAHDRAAAHSPGCAICRRCSNPSKAFAIGLNYIDHATESNFERPKHPVIFQRFASSWVAHEEPLVRPKVSTQFDYEAELVAVIGKAGRYIREGTARSNHVAGYSLFNDGSIRDYQLRTNQWMSGKNFDTSGIFGPEFVTADELPPGADGPAHCSAV